MFLLQKGKTKQNKTKDLEASKKCYLMNKAALGFGLIYIIFMYMVLILDQSEKKVNLTSFSRVNNVIFPEFYQTIFFPSY